tara:strand:- start:459 stop:1697 length:1239 start_codon:yes stop_codon:yes gene_type:complete
MYEILIIGGGISGINSYLELVKMGISKDKIILLEKNNYLGGRIRYIDMDYLENKYIFPAGAARFTRDHKNTIKLLKDFDLIDFRKDKGSIPYSKFVDSKERYKKYSDYENGFKLIDKVIERSRKFDKIELKKMDFKELSEKLLTKGELEYMLISCGYSGQLNNMNAYDGIRLFKKDIRVDIKYYMGKYKILLEKMINYMKNKNYNININMNVTNIIQEETCYKVTVNKKKLYAKKILYCIPKENLLKFNILNPIKNILEKSITTKPLCRVYAIFKKEDIWFKDINKKILTDNDLRYIIPIDADKGIIMISYTDGKYTKKWNSLIETELKEKIVNDVKKVFNINIKKPKKVLVYNWESGVAYWNKGVDSEIISNYLLNPLPNIYISGENYSMRQSWVEGALETSNECVKRIIE